MDVSEAVKVLTQALKDDVEFREAYKANIAMSFKDEYFRKKLDKKYLNKNDLHLVANQAADNFLNLLCE